MITRGDIDGLARGIALGAGLGRLPVAPGSWASLASLPLGWGAHSLGGFPGLAGLTILLFLSGLWAVRRTAGDGDPPEIVIDEIAGSSSPSGRSRLPSSPREQRCWNSGRAG